MYPLGLVYTVLRYKCRAVVLYRVYIVQESYDVQTKKIDIQSLSLIALSIHYFIPVPKANRLLNSDLSLSLLFDKIYSSISLLLSTFGSSNTYCLATSKISLAMRSDICQ